MKTTHAYTFAVVLAALVTSGCASHYVEAANQEQQAADSLRTAGAAEAARAAQQRADAHRQAAKCKDFLECSFDYLGQILLVLLDARLADRNK